MNNRKIFTSESVTQGHPDKLCDLVSDSVLDAVLEQDPMGRVACETAATTGMVLVMGEITTSARIDIAQIARKAICDAGYDRPRDGLRRPQLQCHGRHGAAVPGYRHGR